MQSCPLVHTLEIEFGFRLTSEGLEAAMRGWSNLTHLRLGHTRGGSHITNMNASCPNLKSLRLSTPTGQRGHFTDAEEGFGMPSWVASLGRSLGAMGGLESINCGGTEFSAEVLIDILAHCVKCPTINVDLSESEFELDLPQLSFLSVSTSHLRGFTLSSSSVSSVTCPEYSSWHQLEALTIIGCHSLANVCLNCPNLKKLDLR